MPRRRDPAAGRVVHRTARIGLRVTPAQRRRCFGLLRSAGDVWACALEVNWWRRRRLLPVRFYHGTFHLADRRLRLPTAAGCPPLWLRLDRDIPYPAERVRSVTLLADGGRLWLDVTAELPVAAYPAPAPA
ncbi:hypothetical protein ACNTMW_05510 [Planosporangium sp. 12N6]|uniref:hypothetical protein n=1 Tax=Planosporangium spinosum TaxID=3402278 RepID=UPI003CE72024